jgi:hypothetical protein
MNKYRFHDLLLNSLAKTCQVSWHAEPEDKFFFVKSVVRDEVEFALPSSNQVVLDQESETVPAASFR